MPKKCCVKQCKSTGQSMHRFPNPRVDINLFFEWVKILGVENFRLKTPEQVYNNLRVCFAHFDRSCKSPGHHTLYRYAIPTIGIPALDSDTQASSSTAGLHETATVVEPTEEENADQTPQS